MSQRDGESPFAQDANGVPIPDDAMELYLGLMECEDVVADLAAMKRWSKRFGQSPSGVWFPWQAFQVAVQRAKDILRLSMPTHVCPKCDREGCEYCAHRILVPRTMVQKPSNNGRSTDATGAQRRVLAKRGLVVDVPAAEASRQITAIATAEEWGKGRLERAGVLQDALGDDEPLDVPLAA